MSVLLRFFFVLALCAATPSWAAVKAFTIDPAHTRVIFAVSHLGVIDFPGHAHNITGRIDFDLKNAENSSVDLTIDATQIGMDHKVLDEKLQGKEFFNTAKFPTMTFKSTHIHQIGLEAAKITGDFTMLGVTRPVTLDVHFNGRKWNKYMKREAAGFTATGSLRRSDFGMKSYLPDIGDLVTLQIVVEAHEIRPENGDKPAQ